jgi:hypothetical protein
LVLGESVTIPDVSALILILIAMVVVLSPNINLNQILKHKSEA